MQNAERRMQNDFTTLRFAHKERRISAERGARNTERLCSAKATQTRKKLIDYICIYPTFFGLCSLDAIRDKGKTTKGCCTNVLRPEGVLPLTK